MIFANFISHNSRSSIHVIPNQNGHVPSCKFVFLPSANEVCEGYVFTRVCHSVHGGGVSRPRPRGEVGWSGQGGVQAQAREVVSRPRPRPWVVVSRPRSGYWGCPGPGQGVCVSQHVLRQIPPSRRLLLLMVRILLECILVNTHSFANKYYSIFFCTMSVCYFPRDFISVWSQLYTGTSNQLIWDQNMSTIPSIHVGQTFSRLKC